MELLLMFLGFVLYILIGILKTKKKYNEKFNVWQYLKDELLTILIAAVSAVILYLVMPDISTMLDPKYAKLTNLIAVSIGLLNYSLLRPVIDTVIPKKFVEK